MKVLHITTGLSNGGAEAALFRLATVGNTQCQHRVVSLSSLGKYGELLSAREVHVEALGLARGRMSVSAMRRLHSIIRHERPDVVQTWMYHGNLVGGLIAKISGSPVVWGLHHSDTSAIGLSRATRLVNRTSALLSGFVPKAIVACAQAARDGHINDGYHARKFEVIPNGYELDKFRYDRSARASMIEELQVPPRSKLIGCVARHHPIKGHSTLLAAFRSVVQQRDGIILALVGAGCTPENKQLVEQIEGHGLSDKVKLLGERSDIPHLMSAFDIHVLSSYSEAFPNVIAEAMACQTPCVATSVGDVPEIIGKLGFLAEPRSEKSLQSAIEHAVTASDDQILWAKLGADCRARIEERFSMERMARAYNKVWETAAA